MPNFQKILSPKAVVVSPEKKDLEKIQKKNIIKNNVTVRDPTPALIKSRLELEQIKIDNHGQRKILNQKQSSGNIKPPKKCPLCADLNSAMEKLTSQHQ